MEICHKPAGAFPSRPQKSTPAAQEFLMPPAVYEHGSLLLCQTCDSPVESHEMGGFDQYGIAALDQLRQCSEQFFCRVEMTDLRHTLCCGISGVFHMRTGTVQGIDTGGSRFPSDPGVKFI